MGKFAEMLAESRKRRGIPEPEPIVEIPALDCGHAPSPHESFTTGYGTTSDGKKHCYECIAIIDQAQMVNTGKATLYLSVNERHGYEVTNWPASIRFRVNTYRKGHHNIAGSRYDVWFTGPDNRQWHGVQYGYMTQIVHCKRTKE